MSLMMVAMVVEKYGLRLDVDQLAEVFDMKPRTVHNQISAGTFPVMTYVDGRKRYADCRDVAAYMDACREAARQSVASGEEFSEFLQRVHRP